VDHQELVKAFVRFVGNGKLQAKLELTDEDLVERIIAYNKDLCDQPNCIRKTSWERKALNCSRLLILNESTSTASNLYQKALAHFQLFFGELEKHQQQQKVLDWIQYGGTTSHQPFLLPFVTPPCTAIACLKEIEGHMICNSALLSLLGVGSYWYNTCHTFVNEGTIARHGLCSKDSNHKRKFAEEEEEDLKAFMDNLIFFVEPSATRFVREVTG
jgi:hypothetical protein